MTDESKREPGMASFTLSGDEAGAGFALHAGKSAPDHRLLDAVEDNSSARQARSFTIIDATAEPADARFAPPWSRAAERPTAAPAPHPQPLPGKSSPISTASPELLAAFRGAGGAARAAAVRRDLTAAVDHWWRNEELPPTRLLQDGLLLLEAGLPLDETQRTLLARTALARRRGMVTALRHLRDPERSAGLLHEALQRRLLAPDDLRRLLREDPTSRVWAPLLATEVRADLASPLPAVADRAETLLQVLAAERGVVPLGHGVPPTKAAAVTVDDLPAWHGRWRVVLAALIVLALALTLVWALLEATPAATIAVPGGDYPIGAADGSRNIVTLAPYRIDRTEVTRDAWAACIDRGGCPALAVGDPALGSLPVAEVTHGEAASYCALLGMRLPTAAEWQVAASWAPATQRTWEWPWGDAFQPDFVIGAGNMEGSAPVGSRSPQGDSALGASDMSGNVAEWTATADEVAQVAAAFGGSWSSSPDELRISSFVLQPLDARSPAVGFRCAASVTP